MGLPSERAVAILQPPRQAPLLVHLSALPAARARQAGPTVADQSFGVPRGKPSWSEQVTVQSAEGRGLPGFLARGATSFARIMPQARVLLSYLSCAGILHTPGSGNSGPNAGQARSPKKSGFADR